MLRKLRRWATLAPADRKAVTEAWLLLVVARLSLGPLGLDRCQRLLASSSPPRSPEAEPVGPAASRLGHWVGVAAANHPGSPRCLPRALVLRAMLARRGHEAVLRIGVRRPGSGLEAHAWVECGGRAVGAPELEDGGYSALLPAAGGR